MSASSTASIDSLARSVASSWISLAACSASFVPARTSSAVFCASCWTWVAWSWIFLASSWSTPPPPQATTASETATIEAVRSLRIIGEFLSSGSTYSVVRRSCRLGASTRKYAGSGCGELPLGTVGDPLRDGGAPPERASRARVAHAEARVCGLRPTNSTLACRLDRARTPAPVTQPAQPLTRARARRPRASSRDARRPHGLPAPHETRAARRCAPARSRPRQPRGRPSRRAATAASTSRAISPAASGFASPRAAAAMSSRAASTASVSARSRSGVSSASGSTRAAPASVIQRALVVWWSPVACGYGISTAGRPYWASSKIEPPERATAASAAASATPNGVR